MPKIGALEIFLILLIVLVVFGAGRLQEIGTGLGKSIRGFKDAMAGKEEEKKEADKGVTASSATSAPAQPTDTKKSA